MVPVLKNVDARKLFLHRQGLSTLPTGKLTDNDLLTMIDSMGFVQIDSINTVERAHHMILFSRNQTYKRQQLITLIEKDRSLFENWTHDASVIPSRFYKYWKHRFRRRAPVLLERWKNWRQEGFEDHFDSVLNHVRTNGPTMSRDLKSAHPKQKKTDGWWDWHPSKTALEFLWHTGELAVSGREGFQKVYDLSSRVISDFDHEKTVTEEEFINWACRSALYRLGFASSGEIAAFWDVVSPAEVKKWCDSQPKEELCEIAIETADRSKHHRAYARPDVFEEVQQISDMPKRIRVLSPFDPVLRDRKRALRLFNFDYRIEVFVPETKRQYGYYVFPLIEGHRVIGRIDMKCHRKEGILNVEGLWLERGVRFSAARENRLAAELGRIRRFTSMEAIKYANGFLRPHGVL